jgi:hypothetical protein
MLRELKASRMGHWLEKKEDFFILSQEVKEVSKFLWNFGRKLKICFSLN